MWALKVHNLLYGRSYVNRPAIVTNPKNIPIAAINQVKNSISNTINKGGIVGNFYKKILGDVPTPEIIKQAIDNDVIGRGFFGADVNDLVEVYNKGGDIMDAIAKINTPAEIYKVPVLRKFLSMSQKVGEAIEDNARLAMFKQGLKNYGGDVIKAREYVDKHLFDYLTGLGEGDKIIKRFIPFWSWSRFNIPLQVGGVAKAPIRQLAIQKSTKPIVDTAEQKDKGYQYLSEKEKEQGYIKVGEETKGSKVYDKYIKTASVLPSQDLAKVVNIFRGKTEDIGFNPMFRIFKVLFSDPTKIQTYFGQPVERFKGERKEYFGMALRGKYTELASNIPVLSELNKLIGSSFSKKERPSVSSRVEQTFSPLGVSLVDREANEFYRELEQQKELTGSYTGGLQSIYKRYFIQGINNPDSDVAKKNLEILEKVLKSKGVSGIDILKIKNGAIKDAIKQKIQDSIKPQQ
jgi:hypothetical protein